MHVEDIERLKQQTGEQQQIAIERENESLLKQLNNRLKLCSVTPSKTVNKLIKTLIESLKRAGY